MPIIISRHLWLRASEAFQRSIDLKRTILLIYHGKVKAFRSFESNLAKDKGDFDKWLISSRLWKRKKRLLYLVYIMSH